MRREKTQSLFNVDGVKRKTLRGAGGTTTHGGVVNRGAIRTTSRHCTDCLWNIAKKGNFVYGFLVRLEQSVVLAV